MYSGLSDFIKAILHPSGWGTFPLERWDEGWEETRPLLTVLSCMRFHSSICVRYKKDGGWGVGEVGVEECKTNLYASTVPITLLNG